MKAGIAHSERRIIIRENNNMAAFGRGLRLRRQSWGLAELGGFRHR